MDDDPRFQRFATDPKFRQVAKKECKVKIDPRFKSMFQDRRFVDKVNVDKRGRPRNFASKENFEKFYELASSDSEEEDDQEGGEALSKLKPNVDYARGKGVLPPDSSSGDDDSSCEDDDDDQGQDGNANGFFDKWGELDADAETTDDSTARLAVCNMDWDRVKAEDIFIALNSFCPTGGRVTSVRIFLSDFGKQRLEEEERLGPKELRESERLTDGDDLQDLPDTDPRTTERIRQYQINRLKYYYAVVDFNSVESADVVYKECDGMEYELSATKFDLRFVPDDMTFSDEPTSVCESMPKPEEYRPKVFVNTALKQGKVDLTWDETDPGRQEAMRKAFSASTDADLLDDDLKQYLATSSSDEGDQSSVSDNSADESDQGDVIGKYKALLTDIKQKRSNDQVDMEVTWVSGKEPDSATTAQGSGEKGLTPWEEYLLKRKLKRKQKRRQAKSQPFSDDELPDDVDPKDPFFCTDADTDAGSGRKEVRPKKKGARVRREGPEPENAELSLLLMDEEDDGKNHFDYKDIVKKESKNKKKQKQMEKDRPADSFAMDVKDERFSAMFNNALYNVDPSHPNFKKTKAMQAVIEEKQKRFLAQGPDGPDGQHLAPEASSSSLNQLVHSVRAKSKRLMPQGHTKRIRK